MVSVGKSTNAKDVRSIGAEETVRLEIRCGRNSEVENRRSIATVGGLPRMAVSKTWVSTTRPIASGSLSSVSDNADVVQTGITSALINAKGSSLAVR